MFHAIEREKKLLGEDGEGDGFGGGATEAVDFSYNDRTSKMIKKIIPILFLVSLVFVFFHPVFLKKQIPVPADLIVGAYYPWHDYQWNGFVAGVPVKNPLVSDVVSQIIPFRMFAVGEIKKGILPLWNPLMFDGYPMTANFQTGLYYPFNFLFFLLNFANAWAVQIMLQLVLASIFTYFFLKNLKISTVSSIFGSIIYSFSGFSIIWLEWNIHSQAIAYIPLMLLLVDKYHSSKKIFYLALLSISLAIQIFAGYPQLTLYTSIFLVVWFCWRTKIIRKGENLREAFLFGTFILLGIGLAAIQIVPSLELLRYSTRISESLGSSVRFIPPNQVINLLAPDYFGNPATYNGWGSGDYTNGALYAGAVSFILSCLALLDYKNRREIRFFLFVSLFVLLISISNPIGRFFSEFFLDRLIPSFRATALNRSLVFLNLGMAVLASFGLERFIKNSISKKERIVVYLPFVLSTSLLLGTILVLLILKKPQTPIATDSVGYQYLGAMIKNYNVAFRNLILPIIIIYSTLALLIIGSIWKTLKRPVIYLLLVVMVFELFRFGWKFTPFSSPDFLFPQTPAIKFLQENAKIERVETGDVIPSNMWMPYNLETADGYDPMHTYMSSKMVSVINSNDAGSEDNSRYVEIKNYNTNLFDLTNSKYVMTLKHDKNGIVSEKGEAGYLTDNQKLTSVYEDRSVQIFQNKSFLPRAFFVSDWVEASSPNQVLNILTNTFDHVNRRVVIEGSVLDVVKSGDSTSRVEYLDYQSNQSQIRVENDRPGLLFISDSWYPGWKSTVDGIKTPIYKANYKYRAIPIKNGGTHLVSMYYQPNSFTIGLLVSIISGLLIITHHLWLSIIAKEW